MRPAGMAIVDNPRLPRWIFSSLFVFTSLVVVVNSLESAVAKAPILVLHASLLAVVVFMQYFRSEKYPLHRSHADVLALVFAAVLVGSAALHGFSHENTQALLLSLSFLVCFFAGSQLFRTRQDTHFFLLLVTIVSAIVSVVALIQFAFVGDMRPEFFIGVDRRVNATFGNTTFFSSYIVLVVPILLAFAMHAGTTKWLRIATGTLVAALLVLLAMTSTRTSIIAMLIALPVFLAGMGNRFKKIAIVLGVTAALVAAAAIVALPKLGERFMHSFDSTSTVARRVHFWESGMKAFLDAPLFGHGIGSYEHVMMRYRSPDYWVATSEDVTEHAHNELIETLAETGIIGVLAFCSLVILAVRSGVRSLKTLRQRERLLVWGILCSLLGIAVDGLASISLRTPPVGALAWFLLGLLASSWPKEEKVPAPAHRKTRGWEWIGIAVWIFFAVWYVPVQLDLIRSSQYVINGMLSKYKYNLAGRILEYQAAVRLAPNDTQTLSRLAGELLVVGRHEETLKAVEQLHARNPIYPKSNFQKAIALYSLRRYSEAAAAAQEEIRLRNHPDAFFILARSNERLGDTLSERNALLGLLDADVRGNVVLHLTSASHRLLQLMHSAEERRTLDSLYRNLNARFPGIAVVRQTLLQLDSLSGTNTRAGQPPILPGG